MHDVAPLNKGGYSFFEHNSPLLNKVDVSATLCLLRLLAYFQFGNLQHRKLQT